MFGTNSTCDSLWPSLESAKTDRLSVLFCEGSPKLASIISVLLLSGNSESFVFGEPCLRIDRFRCDTRFIALRLGFAFTVGESCERPSWDLFDITTLCFLFERKKTAARRCRENSWWLLSRCKRWFHSSRVKLPLVNMSAIWFWCPHIWLGSLDLNWFCRTTNPNATRCVLEKCVIVGLLPLMIILITASLSSKMYNWDSPWEESAFTGTWIYIRQINVFGRLLFGFGV